MLTLEALPFPAAAFDALRADHALDFRPSIADQIALVRSVSRRDGSVGRILDGHVNGQERLGAVGYDGLLGVWGAPGAQPVSVRAGRLFGEKTFCSGAGGVDRALVAVDGDLVHVDLGHGVEVDETWYQSPGLRASASHRVVFDGAPVLGSIGPVTAEPWFARDAVRTTATWAGLADAAFQSALEDVRDGLAAGRMRTQLSTIDLWMERAASDEQPTVAFSVHLRDAVAGACRALLDAATRAGGSRMLVTGGRFAQAKLDLDVFLLQHRLDPLVARAGEELVR